MDNDDSPYIYEKPLRLSRTKRSQRLVGLSALGLVGIVSVFGGTALANSLVAEKQNETALPLAGAGSDSPLEATETRLPVSPVAQDANTVASTSLISVPLRSATPANNYVKVDLPSVPSQSFGNTSSATPTAGSYSGSSSSAASYKDSDDPEDRDEQESRHDSDNPGDRDEQVSRHKHYEDEND